MIAALDSSPELFLVLASVLGLMVGSFLNVVIHRLPKMLEREWRQQCAWLDDREPPAEPAYNLMVPGSACPHCGHAIRWFENIPVVSWLILRGHCSACAAGISPRYPLVEAFTGLLFTYVAWRWGVSGQTLAAWLLVASLVALTGIDLDTYLLPDNLTLPLAWLGLLANLAGLFAPLDEAVIGAVAGYVSLWLVFQLFKLLTGKEGMGFGDFKLLSALGAWLGWKLLLPVILVASLTGALVGIGLIVFAGRERAKPIPFGPWLAVGGLVALFWGQDMLALWLG
jgi:leader peptidase (prepilin peptidase)/N-methyltransferase